jgi:uncharacterized protein YacL
VVEIKLYPPNPNMEKCDADKQADELEQQVFYVLTERYKPVAYMVEKKAEQMAEKAASSGKELVVSIIGIIIAIILAVLALGIANWGISVFGISGDVEKAAALVAVAIIIGPTIAAFATKKYF